MLTAFFRRWRDRRGQAQNERALRRMSLRELADIGLEPGQIQAYLPGAYDR